MILRILIAQMCIYTCIFLFSINIIENEIAIEKKILLQKYSSIILLLYYKL